MDNHMGDLWRQMASVLASRSGTASQSSAPHNVADVQALLATLQPDSSQQFKRNTYDELQSPFFGAAGGSPESAEAAMIEQLQHMEQLRQFQQLQQLQGLNQFQQLPSLPRAQSIYNSQDFGGHEQLPSGSPMHQASVPSTSQLLALLAGIPSSPPSEQSRMPAPFVQNNSAAELLNLAFANSGGAAEPGAMWPSEQAGAAIPRRSPAEVEPMGNFTTNVPANLANAWSGAGHLDPATQSLLAASRQPIPGVSQALHTTHLDAHSVTAAPPQNSNSPVASPYSEAVPAVVRPIAVLSRATAASRRIPHAKLVTGDFSKPRKAGSGQLKRRRSSVNESGAGASALPSSNRDKLQRQLSAPTDPELGVDGHGIQGPLHPQAARGGVVGLRSLYHSSQAGTAELTAAELRTMSAAEAEELASARRKYVSEACVPCALAKKACSDRRPCVRCQRKSMPAVCTHPPLSMIRRLMDRRQRMRQRQDEDTEQKVVPIAPHSTFHDTPQADVLTPSGMSAPAAAAAAILGFQSQVCVSQAASTAPTTTPLGLTSAGASLPLATMATVGGPSVVTSAPALALDTSRLMASGPASQAVHTVPTSVQQTAQASQLHMASALPAGAAAMSADAVWLHANTDSHPGYDPCKVLEDVTLRGLNASLEAVSEVAAASLRTVAEMCLTGRLGSEPAPLLQQLTRSLGLSDEVSGGFNNWFQLIDTVAKMKTGDTSRAESTSASHTQASLVSGTTMATVSSASTPVSTPMSAPSAASVSAAESAAQPQAAAEQTTSTLSAAAEAGDDDEPMTGPASTSGGNDLASAPATDYTAGAGVPAVQSDSAPAAPQWYEARIDVSVPKPRPAHRRHHHKHRSRYSSAKHGSHRRPRDTASFSAFDVPLAGVSSARDGAEEATPTAGGAGEGRDEEKHDNLVDDLFHQPFPHQLPPAEQTALSRCSETFGRTFHAVGRRGHAQDMAEQMRRLDRQNRRRRMKHVAGRSARGGFPRPSSASQSEVSGTNRPTAQNVGEASESNASASGTASGAVSSGRRQLDAGERGFSMRATAAAGSQGESAESKSTAEAQSSTPLTASSLPGTRPSAFQAKPRAPAPSGESRSSSLTVSFQPQPST